MKKKKLKSISSLKKKAWKNFSQFIRTKGMDRFGRNVCVTCHKVLPWKSLQAGHFIDGRCNSILFEEMGVHPQCLVCNIFKKGNKIEYYDFMLKKYGQEKIDYLRKLAEVTMQFRRADLEEIIKKYEGS